MRHAKRRQKLGKTSSHRRCMMANMLKSLIYHGSIETTLTKAKVMRSYADQMITLAKKNTLAARRKAIAMLMITYNSLTPKERRQVKNGDLTPCNVDRQVVSILFDKLSARFNERNGGYTQIIKVGRRVGDHAPTCILKYLDD